MGTVGLTKKTVAVDDLTEAKGVEMTSGAVGV